MCICDYAPSLCFLFFFLFCFVLCVLFYEEERRERRGGEKKNKKEPRSTYVPPGFAPIFVSCFFFSFVIKGIATRGNRLGFVVYT